MMVHVCLLLYRVDDLVCKVQLKHERLNHRLLWNISLLFIVLDGTGYTISRTIVQGLIGQF